MHQEVHCPVHKQVCTHVCYGCRRAPSRPGPLQRLFRRTVGLDPTPTPLPQVLHHYQTPCTFFATALNQNITINNACMVMWDATLPIQPWW